MSRIVFMTSYGKPTAIYNRSAAVSWRRTFRWDTAAFLCFPPYA